jgi:hypothetical protein
MSTSLTPKQILRSVFGTHGDGTHLHVIGSSRSGKSRFLEAIFRSAVYEDSGIAIIDWHGSLYDAALNYLAFHQIDREVFLLNPSDGKWVTPYNPFRFYGGSVSANTSRSLDATIKSWAAKDTNATPLLEETAKLLFHFAITSGETLPNAIYLLKHEYPEVLDYAIRLFKDDLSHANAYENARALKGKWDPGKPKPWDDAVSSTARRISRFLEAQALRRAISFEKPKLDIGEILDRNAILLVNLRRTREMYADEAKTFASFLLSDFFDAAVARGETDERYLLVLDEFQQYVTSDMASMLDEVLKFGLHLGFAHQRLEHLEREPALRDAVFGNARVKAAFGLDEFNTAEFMANQLFMSEIVADTVKHEIIRPGIVAYSEELVETFTEYTASSRGSTQALKTNAEDDWRSPYLTEGESESDSKGMARGTAFQLRPVLDDMLSSRTFYTIEEKRAKAAHRLMSLPQRHCAIRIKGADAVMYEVPEVRHFECDDEVRADYELQAALHSGAVPPEQADAHLEKSRAEFLATVKRRPNDRRVSAEQDPKPNTRRPRG